MSNENKLQQLITEKEQLEKKLKESKQRLEALKISEKQYRKIIENTRDIIYRIRMKPELVFEYLSPITKDVVGYDPSELLQNPEMLVQLIHPDDLWKLEQLKEAKADTIRLVIRWRTKDGDVIWTEQLNRLIRDDGELVEIIGIGRDVTEREKLRQELEKAYFELLVDREFESIAHSSKSQDEMFPEILDKVLELFSFDVGAVYIKDFKDDCFNLVFTKGKPSEFFTSMARIPIKNLVNKETLLKGEISLIESHSMIKEDKKSKDFGISSLAFIPLTIGRDVIGFIIVASKGKRKLEEDDKNAFRMIQFDLSLAIGRVMLEEELKKKNKELQEEIERRKQNEEQIRQKNKELSDFAHFFSHDIRNALAGVEGYLDLYLETKNEDYLHKIFKKTQFLKKLLDQSLSLAEAGIVVEKKLCENLDQLVRDVAAIIIPENITYTQDKLPDLVCDEEKVKQIFMNLFNNAITHGRPSKIFVQYKENNDKSIIIIGNDGEQIKEEDKSKIFDKGFSTKGGAGLGLAIVQKIVKALGWSITVESTKENTLFIISIPAVSKQIREREN
ncbi:MAG: sensor histidine kinase [Candidatus Heimdallarchaeaceae archaeon]